MIIDFDTVVNKLAADMDNRVLRNELIASNVANLDTPGYKAQDVKFERILADNIDGLQMKRTHAMHMANGTGATVRANEIVESNSEGRADGNNVNVDEEMLKMTENSIQYNAAVQLVSKKLKFYQEAIAAK